jgi:predicted nucleic acid-binding protein
MKKPKHKKHKPTLARTILSRLKEIERRLDTYQRSQVTIARAIKPIMFDLRNLALRDRAFVTEPDDAHLLALAKQEGLSAIELSGG